VSRQKSACDIESGLWKLRLQDVRCALRMLSKNLALTVVFVASLANVHSTCVIENSLYESQRGIQ